MEIIYKKVQDLIPYVNNSRTHSEEQINQICASINEFGFTNPLLIDEKDSIIAGHGRLLASKKLGMEEVPCIVLEGLTEAQKKAYIIADNKMALNAGWDEELLKIELENLKELDFDLDLTGFNVDELDELFKEDEEEQEIIEDDFDIEPPEEPKAKLGDIYQLGSHRLMCGNSTKIEDVEKLMNGNLIDLFLSDPPYNVDYSSKNKFLNKFQKGNRIQKDIENDKMSSDDFYQFLLEVFNNACIVMKDGASYYIFYPNAEYTNFKNSLEDSGLKVHQYLVWVKNNHVLGMNDYQYKHEPVFYGWKEGDSHKWFSDRSQTTVLNFNKPLKNDLHPTMKPIDILAYLINNSSNKDYNNVLDLFGGSGSTLIACEQLNRNCYMMELDPHYVDVIIDRWENFTGKKAVKLNE